MEPDSLALRRYAVNLVFRPAAPVDERALFAGRVSQIDRVLEAVTSPGQHAVIYGERGVGKTSLANVLGQLLEGIEEEVLAVRVNCDGTDNFFSLWRKPLRQVSITLRARGIGLLPQTNSEHITLDALLPEDPVPDDIITVLRILPPGLVVVLFDEFDRLTDIEARALMTDTLKTLSDQGFPVTIVLVGVADSVTELVAQHQSIERALVQIEMPRMTREELGEVVDRGLARLGMGIAPPARELIVSLSLGLPHYTHLLAKHGATKALEKLRDQITIGDARGAIEAAIDTAQASIAHAYHRATTSPRRESLFREVLLACALARVDSQGYFRAADVREPMSRIMGRPYDIPAFTQHLNEFASETRGRILEKVGQRRRFRFRFVNPLMQPYVLLRGLRDGLIVETDLGAFSGSTQD